MANVEAKPSRLSSQVAKAVRENLFTKALKAGDLLPGERTLARQHQVSGKTIRRAMKILESEGLISAESRRGYRVLDRSVSPDSGSPLALVFSKPAREGAAWFYRRLLNELQDAAGSRGWPLLGVSHDGQTSEGAVGQLRKTRTFGVILNGVDKATAQQIGQLNIPAIVTDFWDKDLGLDTVIQDGFAGAMMGAEYLASRGHTRIALACHPLAGATAQVIERYGGAVCGLARHGIALAPKYVFEAQFADLIPFQQRFCECLKSKDRPTAILAPWQSLAIAAAQATRSCGLVVGKDLELVGWSTEEDLDVVYAPVFSSGQYPPSIVWSARSLAEVCIDRLLQRRSAPHAPVTLTRVPMRLRVPQA